MNEENIRKIISDNIVKYRKHANFTQLELAEKLNYTDKAISKWERGEALPDIYTLYQLAEIFKVPLQSLLTYNSSKKIHIGISVEKRVLVPLTAGCGIFLIATVFFGILILLDKAKFAYLSYIYAFPLVMLVTFILSQLWEKFFMRIISLSALLWGIALALYLSFNHEGNYIFFIIAIPGQLFLIFLYLLLFFAKKNKKKLR